MACDTNVVTVNNARRAGPSDEAYLRLSLIELRRIQPSGYTPGMRRYLLALALSPDSTISIGSFAWPRRNDFAAPESYQQMRIRVNCHLSIVERSLRTENLTSLVNFFR